MNITEEQILEAARLLGCGSGQVSRYANKYGRIDLNELSISIHGKPYEPAPESKVKRCLRCHWPVSECNCSEHIRKRNKVIYESRSRK